MSVAEDRLNKPYRPIAAGVLRMPGAYSRWFLSWTLGPLYMYCFHGSWAAIHLAHWQAWVVICHVWLRYQYSLLKNAFVAYASFIVFRPYNAMASTHTPGWNTGPRPDILLSVWITATVHLQDFHDMTGDKAIGRKTLPLMFPSAGCKALRRVTAAFLVVPSLASLAATFLGSCSGHFPFLVYAGFVYFANMAAFELVTFDSEKGAEELYRGSYHSAAFLLIVHLAQIDII